MPKVSRTVWLAALACGLAACTSSHSPNAGPTASTSVGDHTAATTAAKQAATTTTTLPPTPLEKLLFGTPPPDSGMTASQLRDARREETLVAQCMHDEGFPYTPRAIDASSYQPDRTGPFSLPPEQFAKQYGYGVSTIPRASRGSDDPNRATIKAMSPAERAAYAKALFGASGLTFDANGDPVKPRSAPPDDGKHRDFGCSQKASDAVYGTSGTQQPKKPTQSFTTLENAMADLETRITNDPRTQAALAQWVGCMADAGYPGLHDVGDPMTTVSTRYANLTGGSVTGARTPTTHAPDPTALRQLQTYEIAIATADYHCQIPYNAASRAVRIDLENQFIAQHRAELEQYRAAVQAGTAGKG